MTGAIESDCTGGVVSMSSDSGTVQALDTSNELLVAYSNNLEEFYSAMTLNCLTKLLHDQPMESCYCTVAMSIGHLIWDVGKFHAMYISVKKKS